MHSSCFNEGRAAAILGNPREANPYQKTIDSLRASGVEELSVFTEYASDWESGWMAPALERALLAR